MAKCDTTHTEKYAFSSRHKDGLDLFVEIAVTNKTGAGTKARLAVDWALQRGIICADLHLGWPDFTDYICPQHAVFTGSQFADATFDKGHFENCSFDGCRFYRCRFQGSQFIGCNFTGTVFVESDLDYACFNDCDFSDCVFDRCDFVASNFNSCAFDRVSFAEEADVRRDFEGLLTGWADEVPGLIAAFKNGLIDGCGHDGECVDLMATLHRLRGKKYKPSFSEVPSPAELWLQSIAKGDKPGDPTPAGHAAAKAGDLPSSQRQRDAGG